MNSTDFLVTAGAMVLIAFIVWWFRLGRDVQGHAGETQTPDVSASVLRTSEQQRKDESEQEGKR